MMVVEKHDGESVLLLLRSDQKQRTKVKKKTSNPVFDETFSFEVSKIRPLYFTALGFINV